MTKNKEISNYEGQSTESNKTDAILVVDGKKLHVNKALLSLHSEYFDALFDSDTQLNEDAIPVYPIKFVEFEDFVTILSLVHKDPIVPEEKSLEKLLDIADQFLLPNAIRHLELLLCSSTEIAQHKKLELADKFELSILLKKTVDQYEKVEDLVGMKQFLRFSDKTKATIFDRIMEIKFALI